MSCMPFSQLLAWVTEEHRKSGSVFGVKRPFHADPSDVKRLFNRNLETAVGPAAGPNSQLAQNIIASYYAGARFFELKTVQKMDGRELAACVNKPCIKADDEGYNCEWSTELTVPEAQHEYIDAWILLHFMAKEFGLGRTDGFQFNISVGYDLAGIKTEKVNTFIDSMIDARNTDTWKEAISCLKEHVGEFSSFTDEDIEAIPSAICNSATISTLHGCPPSEIESIAVYLLTEKHLNTFVKCNPTLLGYDFARRTMDAMGYDYVAFGKFHFEDDLQYKDAVPMLRNLISLAGKLGLSFGVKLTNTFPVDVLDNELPSKEMYMSGKALYALSISLAARLSADFSGALRISYSGGADAFNIKKIAACGIWPVTSATTLLKAGGYQRFLQMAEELKEMSFDETGKTDPVMLKALAEEAVRDPHHLKPAKQAPSRKNEEKVPYLDCFLSPCQDRCPIHQDVSSYMEYAEKGDFKSAFEVILDTNALPFMTGKICAHGCQGACTRNFYDSPVQIRDTKLTCAEKGIEEAIVNLKPISELSLKTAVIGGGPAGMAAAHYLAKGGAKVTLFEKNEKLGGVVRYIIPDFRIDDSVIDQDVRLLCALGVKIETGREVSLADVRAMGFDAVIVCVGAPLEGTMKIEGASPLIASEFLASFNKTGGKVPLGRRVAVIGGGNTAMDTARAAKRNSGVETVSLIYRRTKKYMPADEEELVLAQQDGVEFFELLNPKSLIDGKLLCSVMQLSDADDSGRRSVIETGKTASIDTDSILLAVGEKCPKDWYEQNGIHTDEKGRPLVNEDLECSVPGVYIAGDGLYGPSVIVKAEANAKKAAEAVLKKKLSSGTGAEIPASDFIGRKGLLRDIENHTNDSERCLHCGTVCENCADVCPNRANISVRVPGMKMEQIVHVDYMCNECGNCRTFCPYAGGPYQDKWTLFGSAGGMEDSKNDGFLVLDPEELKYRVRFLGNESTVTSAVHGNIPDGLVKLMDTIVKEYGYMLYDFI